MSHGNGNGEWHRRFWRRVRATEMEPHQYVRQTHCGDCLRAYQREWVRGMRALRLPAHEFVHPYHCKDCENQRRQEIRPSRAKGRNGEGQTWNRN